MNEDIQFILDGTEEAMQNAINHLIKQFANIRAGKASPSMLGSVMVDYYGSQTPLAQVANVNTPDSQTLAIQPWENGNVVMTVWWSNLSRFSKPDSLIKND